MRILSLPSMLSLHMTWNFSSMATSYTVRREEVTRLVSECRARARKEAGPNKVYLGVEVSRVSGRLPQLGQVGVVQNTILERRGKARRPSRFSDCRDGDENDNWRVCRTLMKPNLSETTVAKVLVIHCGSTITTSCSSLSLNHSSEPCTTEEGETCVHV